MPPRDEIRDLVNAPHRHVDHHQHLALRDLALERFQARVRHRACDHARHPCAEKRAADSDDEHGEELWRDAGGREQDEQAACSRPNDRADRDPDLRAVNDVRLLQDVRFGEVRRECVARGEKMDVLHFDAREQHFVEHRAGTADVGKNEVEPTPHQHGTLLPAVYRSAALLLYSSCR